MSSQKRPPLVWFLWTTPSHNWPLSLCILGGCLRKVWLYFIGLTLNRHLYKMNSLVKQTSRVGPWRSKIADCWWRWSIFFSDQMCPADVSRLQQPGFWAYYLWHCKCCIYCVFQLLGEPDYLNLTSKACSKQDWGMAMTSEFLGSYLA